MPFRMDTQNKRSTDTVAGYCFTARLDPLLQSVRRRPFTTYGLQHFSVQSTPYDTYLVLIVFLCCRVETVDPGRSINRPDLYFFFCRNPSTLIPTRADLIRHPAATQ